MSYAVLTESLSKAFAGETLDKNDGLLVSSAFDKSVKDTGRFAEAERLFDSMLCDGDADSGLVGDSGRSGEMAKDLSSPTEDIKTMAKSCGTSVGTLMTSAFAYTLSRFTGRSDAVFCVLDNGRSIPGLERSIGMFVRTVPVRIDCSDRAVKEYVSMASKTVYGSIASGFVPFRELSSKYGVKADVLFQYIPVAKYSAVESSDPYEAGGIADMIAITAEHKDKMRLIISHSSRFSDKFIARFAKTFDDVLTEMLTKKKLSDIRFHGDVPARGESRALNHYSAMDAFRESAGKFPDRAAVTYEDRTTSYAEVDAATDGIASKLSEIGVGAGDRVAVLVPRGEWYYICAIGVLKTGAAYVPMDDAYPDERLSFMAEDAGAVVTLVTPETAGRAAAMGLKAVDCASCERRKFQPVGIDPLSPAVVLYTSGTTGKPKGSVITHRAIVNLSEWYVRYTGMSTDDVYALYTSYSFDMHTLGMFPPMFCGASVDIVPERVRLDMAELNRHFVDAGATHTFMTTQVGRLFASMDMPSGIKALMYGGEKLGEFHAPEHLGAIETYGPSENLALSMAIPVNARATPDSVGSPLQNVAAYVLDAEKRLVPYGAIGELHLSGYQLSLGYLNRDDLNSKAFLRNPFSDEPGFERMYATGDFFRILPDSTLGVVGRRDGQVKIRGNRVELTEVEATIKDMPGIRDATVQAVPSGPGKELCAYVVGEAGAEAVKAWVAERKPSYMVPAFVVELESIPRNVNGKVDRRALPAPDSSSLRAEYVQPRNETEEKICNVFETVLNVERVGIDDDFIRLGGDSLKAIRALADIRREMPGFDITPADLMRYHTPRLIAEHTRSAAGLECLYTFEEGCPLPDAMRNLYEIIKEHPDAHYNRPFLFTSESWKCADDAVDAVKRLVDAHPILRARIAEREDGPWLTFDGPADIKVVNADPADSKDAFVRGFDIFGGELCRFQVHEWEGAVSLLMDAHHIVFDGVSFVPMAMDFACAINGIGIPMDDGVLRSASYDVSSRGRTRYNRSKALAERAVIGCSADFLEERPCERVFGDFEGGFSTPRDRIAECVKKNDTSVTAFFATALEYAFKNISGKEKCLFFITEDGRGHMDLSGSIGMYARGFPAAVAIRERSPAKVLQKMTDHVMASMTYDEYPYWELRRYMDVESVVRLQYAHFTGMDSDIVDRVPFEVEPLIRSGYRPLTDLWIRVSDDGDGYSLQIYASERYDDAVVSEVAEEFDKAVAFLTEELSRGQEASSLTV
jgi:amino acid adenylation domain-containing protein